MRRFDSIASLLVCSLLALAVGCASDAPPDAARSRSAGPIPTRVPDAAAARSRVVRTANAQVGAPYRYGGSSPSGFDCSGLVVYSYGRAGVNGLPHSASRLDDLATEVALGDVEPGDLLFFDLGGKKARHVGIYVGGHHFVHAPSSGKAVERVRFDHVYWSRHLRRAGRLIE